jgi:hypothetical protein
MKKLLLLLLLAAPASAGTRTYSGTNMTDTWNGQASGATTFTYVQSKSCHAETYVDACAFTTNITAGSVLIVGCTEEGVADLMTVTDNNGNIYTPAFGSAQWQAQGAGTARVNVWYTLNANAGATTVTCQDTGHTAAYIQPAIHEYLKSKTTTFDVSVSSLPITQVMGGTVNITTSLPNEFVFTFLTQTGTSVTGQTGTLRENYAFDFYLASQDQVFAVAQSNTSSFTAPVLSFPMTIAVSLK